MQQNTGPLAFSLRCLYRVGSRFLSFEGKALALQKAVSFGLRHQCLFCWWAWGMWPGTPAHHTSRSPRWRAVWMEEGSPVSVVGARGGYVKYMSTGPHLFGTRD